MSYFVLELVELHAPESQCRETLEVYKDAFSIRALNQITRVAIVFSSCEFCSIVFFKVLSAVVRLKSMQNLWLISQPFLTKYTKTHDTCGVNNLHGMPGILGAIAGAIAAANANADKYGYDG